MIIYVCKHIYRVVCHVMLCAVRAVDMTRVVDDPLIFQVNDTVNWIYLYTYVLLVYIQIQRVESWLWTRHMSSTIFSYSRQAIYANTSVSLVSLCVTSVSSQRHVLQDCTSRHHVFSEYMWESNLLTNLYHWGFLLFVMDFFRCGNGYGSTTAFHVAQRVTRKAGNGA